MLRLQRDTWLSTVAAELRTDPALHDASTWLLARRTAEELDRFVSRGPWREWRTAGLPDGSSRLREALYHVALANAGQDLSARQVLRILGQASSVLCH
ncbi:hypothetical protein DFQ15_1182 [Xylophilus ampelinus]|uniref:Uncharacterized protein n=2 Tax=Xylophilus ampelinus TaxID=54067 RepID=A0A318SDZ4_9BURK|nr:hypothetical protein DFQ15_1182 [Xylophilus ampelinus]